MTAMAFCSSGNSWASRGSWVSTSRRTSGARSTRSSADAQRGVSTAVECGPGVFGVFGGPVGESFWIWGETCGFHHDVWGFQNLREYGDLVDKCWSIDNMFGGYTAQYVGIIIIHSCEILLTNQYSIME